MTTTARTLQAVGVLIICLILYVAWFLAGRPVITTDYIAELNNLVRPSADDSLNAAPLYQKAIDTLVDVNDVKELLRLDFHDANDQRKELIRQWLAKNQTSLDLVAKGSQLPYFWQPYQSKAPEQSVMSVLLPNLTFCRAICYALCWQSWLNAEDGNINAALSDIEALYRFGRHNKSGKILIEQLVGIAIEGRAMGTTRWLLDTYKIDPGTLAEFQRRLQHLIDNDTFGLDIQSEKLFMFDEIQRCFTESRFGPAHVYPRRLVEISYIAISMDGIPSEVNQLGDLDWALASVLPLKNFPCIFTHPNKAESIASANALYKFWDENITKTPAQLHAEQIDLDAESRRLIKNNIVLKVLTPGLERLHMVAWRNKVDAEGTLVTIALVRYKQDTGNYPETLDKLVETKYIRQVPIDPFSDKPVIYRKTADGCILYSVGANLTDDGGQVARDENGKIEWGSEQGDWVFWPVEKD